MRSRWLEVYDFVRDSEAKILAEDIGKTRPFSKIGIRPAIAVVSAVQRISSDTFETRWEEQAYEHDGVVFTERFIGRVVVTFEAAKMGTRQNNPFGLRFDDFGWSRETQPAP